MKEWLNIVGYSIPEIIELGRVRRVYGSPVLNRFYGLYSMDKKWVERIKMIRYNGTRC
jgi:hypothetical protein